MRIVKIVLLSLVGLLLALVGMTLFLLNTTIGLNFLVGQANRYVPQLTSGSFNGSVLKLDAKNVVWEQPGVVFKGNFGWHLNFKRLLSGEVVLDDFYVSQTQVNVDTAAMPPTAPETDQETQEIGTLGVRNLRSSLPIHIERIALSDILVDADGQKLLIHQLQSAFHWSSDGIDVPLMDLNGSWRSYPLTLEGTLNTRQDGKLLHLSDIALRLGKNKVEVKGDVRFHATVPNLDLAFNINAPNFSEIVDGLQGSAKGRLQVRGPILMPLINADLSVNDWVSQEISVKSIRLTGGVSTEENISGGVKLNVSGIALPGLFIDRINADLQGTQTAHELRIISDSALFKLNATLAGALNDTMDAWNGALKKLEVQTDYGPVTLTDPMMLAFDTNRLLLNVGHFCLTHHGTKVCLNNDLAVDLLTKSPFEVKVALEKFDLGLLKRYISGKFETNGIMQAQADFVIPQGFAGLPTGTLTVNSQGLSTRYILEESDVILGFDKIELAVNHDGKKINSKWSVQLTKNGKLTGDVDIVDPMKSRQMQGTLKIDHLSASIVNPILSLGETAQGTVYGDLRLGGNLNEPLLYGQAGIRDMRIDSTKFPFEMLPSTFVLIFNGSKSTLEGELKTPKGALFLEGEADWETLSQPHAHVVAKSTKLRVTMPPIVEFDLTTDVRCEASAEKIVLDGVIDLPWARVKVYNLPASAIDVSDDTVRLDRPRVKKADNGKTIPIESKLLVNIGDDVKIDAMGLKAQVMGKLHVVQNNGKMGLTGQVIIPHGQFKAYGQDLIVRRGELMFAGAVNNPLINLEAIRNPEKTADDVVAGIRVTGQADNPEVTIFTEPNKSQTESLSYLIRGEGLDPTGEDDNSMITSALIGLGLSQGGRVIESLGDAVGISGLGVDTEGVGDSSKVAVSGYILPGVKVKYSVGLFDSLATLTLRYRVIPNLYIEAASGVNQALDVLYSFEF